MKLRAVIFDIYKTVLEVGPPPRDRNERWAALWRETFGASARLSLVEFMAACDQVIAREHAGARGAGIAFPEIYWRDVVLEVLPELGGLPAVARDEFLFLHQALLRTVRLMPGAGGVLQTLRERDVVTGIASNAQPYTLRELDEALTEGGLSRDIFSADVCFWSFAHGFSKPDPHVFRLLTARLRARGVAPAETLMVGDRSDNDIMPARAQGWNTWQLMLPSADENGGDWIQLGEFIAAQSGRSRL